MRLRSEDKHHLRKSADRKAQISPVSGTNALLICAFRSADFLRWCLSSERDLMHNLFFGASLSEPHSYVLTRTFVIGDIYKSSVRPLGFVPATIQPKSRANPVLRLCLPLALIDNDFLSKECLSKSPVFFFLFLHPLHRVFSCPLKQTRSGFFSTSILSFFTLLSRTRDRRLASEIPLSTLVAVDRLTSFEFSSVRRRCMKAPRKQPMGGIESSASKRTN